jgi:hypothetical protein
MAKFYWKKKKTIGMYLNRRQWERDFDPDVTFAQEIQLEHNNNYLVVESSQAATPNYIITE